MKHDYRRGQPAPWLYLFGTLAWTWAFWGAALFTGREWTAPPTLVLFVLGTLGPMGVALLLVASGHWEESLAAFLRRTFHPAALPPRWYGYIVALVLLRAGLPVLLAALLLEGGISDRLTLSAPTAFLVVGLLAGAVEEPGWRGYAQEALQRRISVLAAGLVTGVFWAAWHLPLFLLPGTYQHGLGLGSEAFWLFNLAILAGSPFYAWMVNAAGRTALSAVLYHGLGNVAVELLSVSGARRLELLAEVAITLVVVIAAWRSMRTSRPPLN